MAIMKTSCSQEMMFNAYIFSCAIQCSNMCFSVYICCFVLHVYKINAILPNYFMKYVESGTNK
jgi:hypothetical protein